MKDYAANSKVDRVEEINIYIYISCYIYIDTLFHRQGTIKHRPWEIFMIVNGDPEVIEEFRHYRWPI